MSTITKAERSNWESKLYIYEAASEVLKAKIKLVNIEYDMLAKKEGYTEVQKTTDRIKKIESIAGKLEKNGLEFTYENIAEHIRDVVGCRIVLLTLTDLYAFVDLLSKTINATEGFKLVRTKDYISEPKPSGYQSYHMNVMVPVTFSNEKYDVSSEIQIRTTAMDAWATLEHKLGYKPSEELETGAEILKMQFDAYAKMVETVDQSVAKVAALQKKLKK